VGIGDTKLFGLPPEIAWVAPRLRRGEVLSRVGPRLVFHRAPARYGCHLQLVRALANRPGNQTLSPMASKACWDEYGANETSRATAVPTSGGESASEDGTGGGNHAPGHGELPGSPITGERGSHVDGPPQGGPVSLQATREQAVAGISKRGGCRNDARRINDLKSVVYSVR
jgi:hypothetical protein